MISAIHSLNTANGLIERRILDLLHDEEVLDCYINYLRTTVLNSKNLLRSSVKDGAKEENKGAYLSNTKLNAKYQNTFLTHINSTLK